MFRSLVSWIVRWIVMRTPPGSPFVVGLTGGIASGKTAVSDFFAAHGIAIVDTDLIAREIVEPGQPALFEITQRFGESIVKHGGELDRAALRERVFHDAKARQALEKITHPRIRAAARDAVNAAVGPYVVFVVPLLVESPLRYAVDRILVVDVEPPVQLARLLQRDGVSAATAEAMIAAQTDRETRLAAADDVITNSGTLDDLKHAVEQLHEQYLAHTQKPS